MNNLMIKCYVATRLRMAEFGKDSRGVTAIEYALIAVAMATLLALILGNQDSGFLGALNKTFTAISDAITGVTLGASKGS
ncbi:Flp family type IVb pilin [Mixta theicola]|uniref:Flp family type IVb pilin n=1 Tax=Mixta theicola TaxID=1458355 RepID=A0A2K1Q9Y8_9GAMM|nr:Flp family type IVb pilin [Mixta theicola]PNS11839.1 Flp family type IVb pilin [Mixta theicola]GLR07763.1 pilus assembly protein PilA [Mixta theicola]